MFSSPQKRRIFTQILHNMNFLYWFTVLCMGLISGALAGFIISLGVKWRVFEWYMTRRRPTWPTVCYFCLGFWIAVSFNAIFVSANVPGFWPGFYHIFFASVIGTMISVHIKLPG